MYIYEYNLYAMLKDENETKSGKQMKIIYIWTCAIFHSAREKIICKISLVTSQVHLYIPNYIVRLYFILNNWLNIYIYISVNKIQSFFFNNKPS